MADLTDHYEAYYADKLWSMLPAVYRMADSDTVDRDGPLRELVNRIGAQAAILRRSIDRLWEDQSIETCDDWVIPYIGDLLATDLVPSLDSRGQRLDVAKTIYYRRRKGTVALIEELATDITGWDARVVEFFRRMARTRHNLDPAIGWPPAQRDPVGAAELQRAQGILGKRTSTPAGGTADLRSAPGSRLAHTAFDEFSHLADVRRGRGQFGWLDIPHLGVFLWRLLSMPMGQTTPVPVDGCEGQFTVDPTGRDIPLFAAGQRTYGDAWVSPDEWQMPGPISRWLLQVERDNLCAGFDPQAAGGMDDRSLGIWAKSGISYEPVQPDLIAAVRATPGAAYRVDPERGRVQTIPPIAAADLRVTYHAGFPSTIGAGPYDRRQPGVAAEPAPGALTEVTGGGDALELALTSLGATGTVEIGDFLTYTPAHDVTGIADVCVRARNRYRPLIRLPEPIAALPPKPKPKPGPPSDQVVLGADKPVVSPISPLDPLPKPELPPIIRPSRWVFEADGSGQATLALTGLFVSGGDIVLSGDFAAVTISCCTFDAGTAGAITSTFAKAADGRDLAPCRLIVTGLVRQLVVERSVLGPIRAAGGGKVERLSAADSIVQATDDGKALDLPDMLAQLSRCTVLGPVAVHRLEASECIFDDDARVEDAQHGCVRFSAHTAGSDLPRQYECVVIAKRAPLFVSRDFGSPAYGQLRLNIGQAILAGAEDGSEMGAYSREKGAIKERALLIKFEEYMPLGLAPVVVYVT